MVYVADGLNLPSIVTDQGCLAITSLSNWFVWIPEYTFLSLDPIAGDKLASSIIVLVWSPVKPFLFSLSHVRNEFFKVVMIAPYIPVPLTTESDIPFNILAAFVSKASSLFSSSSSSSSNPGINANAVCDNALNKKFCIAP